MITKKLFNSLFPTAGLTSAKNLKKFNLVRLRDELIAAMNEILPKYGIDNYYRICAFWASCGIETDHFKTTTEYASGEAYEGRAGLGNFFAGDGKKFKGRTLIQTTGRYNVWRVVCRFVKKLTGKDFSKDEDKYKNFRAYLSSADYQKLISEADRLGVNFLAFPERLGQIETAVEAACIFWEENNLNYYADRGRFKELNGIINRGDKDKTSLHWEERNKLYKTCLVTVPRNFKFDKPNISSKEVENSAADVPASPIVADENNSPESLAVPVPEVGENRAAENSEAAGEQKLDKTKVKEFGEKFLRHCKTDSVKNILLVVGTRIFSTISGVWLMGIHGKILLIAAAVAILFFTGRAVYIYSPRIVEWSKKLFNFFFGN